MRTVDEILEQARRLPPDEQRKIAAELLKGLEQAAGGIPRNAERGPYADWLAAAGSVRSDFDNLSRDKYQHVAGASLDEHDEK